MSKLLYPLWLASLLSGCSVSTVEPKPFRGTPPQSLLVAPIENDSGQPDLEVAFVAGAAEQLEDRGYYVYPTDTGLSLMRGRGMTPENLNNLGRELHLDAVLVITVTSWYAVFDRVLETLSYDVTYRILSTIDGQVIWEHEAVGNYQREREPVRIDVGRYSGPAFPGPEGSTDPSAFRDSASVASALSRSVFQYLPNAPDTQRP